jgi:hypothetical protein
MRLGVFVLVLATVSTAGCAASQVERAASAVRRLAPPVVANVHYHPANFLDPETVDVILQATATDRDAEIVWCSLLLPNGLSERETVLWSSDTLDSWPVPTSCQTP